MSGHEVLSNVFIKGIDGKTFTFYDVKKNCLVADFKKMAVDKMHPGMDPEDLILIYVSKQLQSDGRTLADYNVTGNATFHAAMRLHGGINPFAAAKQKKWELKPLPGFIQVTSSASKPCMISLDDDPSTKRAIMPCGHVISPTSMFGYAESCASENKYSFPCPFAGDDKSPACPSTWEYFMVLHVANPSEESKKKIETAMGERFARLALGAQDCPGCTTLCLRRNPKDISVICPVCTRKNKREFEFCWCCLKKATSHKCTNPECNGSDPKIKILKECPNKEIYGVKTPSIRACPKCSALINHKDQCRRIDCLVCKCSFCFICLKVVTPGGDYYPCGDKCKPAPPQNML